METEGSEGEGAGRVREQPGGEAGSDAATAADGTVAAAAAAASTDAAVADEAMDGAAAAVGAEAGSAKAEEEEYAERVARLKGVLSGETPIGLTLQFLFSHRK